MDLNTIDYKEIIKYFNIKNLSDAPISFRLEVFNYDKKLNALFFEDGGLDLTLQHINESNNDDLIILFEKFNSTIPLQ